MVITGINQVKTKVAAKDKCVDNPLKRINLLLDNVDSII